MSDFKRHEGLTTRIARRYGRKKGLVRHYWSLARCRLGAFRDFQSVDWSRVDRLVFVCQGNICRSPYAEARMRGKGASALSFGLAAPNGDGADPVAVRVAAGRGVDLSSHQTRGPAQARIGPRDLLLAMEPWQARQVCDVARSAGAQVTLLGLWSARLRPHIEDPYGLSEAYYDNCFALIDSLIEEILRRLPARPREHA